jgi:hypothetical protein
MASRTLDGLIECRRTNRTRQPMYQLLDAVFVAKVPNT